MVMRLVSAMVTKASQSDTLSASKVVRFDSDYVAVTSPSAALSTLPYTKFDYWSHSPRLLCLAEPADEVTIVPRRGFENDNEFTDAALLIDSARDAAFAENLGSSTAQSNAPQCECLIQCHSP